MRTLLGLSMLVSLLLLSACGGGDECLVSGENCTQAYKQNTYGRTDIQCCRGTCEEGIENGVLICQ